MPICISRPKQAGNEPSADVDVSEIYNVHWDNTSGNGRFKHRGYRLYGYISYTRAAELGLSSGSHEYYRNDVKITIHEKYNTAAAYIYDYKSLLLKAGEKPREQHNRSITGETLKKRILRELDDGGKTMKELGDVLLAEKYDAPYNWMVAQMEDRIGKRPEGVTYPIWAWHTYSWKHKLFAREEM